ncbi:hypothetical protein DOTSEDRAFT_32289 [Dothistroma septosporum NZE10]|uniref:Uncharacterized protein n=1 Tax=Dothistroma septosporum (strain NZE10 / CBS 128990) TaxID=675120 RepID=N1PZW4_DOTSN|nr:hypothetical protein DOTSEDRAFT_32289 [Dothistroma septosporum NZE10]
MAPTTCVHPSAADPSPNLPPPYTIHQRGQYPDQLATHVPLRTISDPYPQPALPARAYMAAISPRSFIAPDVEALYQERYGVHLSHATVHLIRDRCSTMLLGLVLIVTFGTLAVVGTVLHFNGLGKTGVE